MREIHGGEKLNWGLMALLGTTLLICAFVLSQLIFTKKLTVTGCTPQIWKSPAIYLEHIGDSDKPIPPIVIAVVRPSELEIGCTKDSRYESPQVFLVRDEEFAQVNTLLKAAMHGGEGTPTTGEFQYRIVSKFGTVESGIFDYTQSTPLFAALGAYFDHRQDRLHEFLTNRYF